LTDFNEDIKNVHEAVMQASPRNVASKQEVLSKMYSRDLEAQHGYEVRDLLVNVGMGYNVDRSPPQESELGSGRGLICLVDANGDLSPRYMQQQ
jgi:hypothetical protein